MKIINDCLLKMRKTKLKCPKTFSKSINLVWLRTFSYRLALTFAAPIFCTFAVLEAAVEETNMWAALQPTQDGVEWKAGSSQSSSTRCSYIPEIHSIWF